MGKRLHLYPPLAKWTNNLTGRARVRLTLPCEVAAQLEQLLMRVAATPNVPLNSAASAARRAAQTLACELQLRPALRHREVFGTTRLTLPESEALWLLVWLLTDTATEDPAHVLRPLINTLHLLLQ